ncbi:hypothetical protein RCO48_07770 [Peribacillus frigoritolerans]|nr:hypothetical protein [Peribacillus frigoritolerans]
MKHSIGSKNDIIVVNAEQPLAFTLGFRRPFIVFSTGLISITGL